MELNPQKNYARCTSCKSIYSIMYEQLHPFPLDESVRDAIEMSLGFSSALSAQTMKPPEQCPSCRSSLEFAKNDEVTAVRCTNCGLLLSYTGAHYVPLHVEAPGGGWDPKFQALFEQKLGFTYKLKKTPPGVPG